MKSFHIIGDCKKIKHRRGGYREISACETCVDVRSTETISIVDGHAVIDIDECIERGARAAERLSDSSV